MLLYRGIGESVVVVVVVFDQLSKLEVLCTIILGKSLGKHLISEGIFLGSF